MKKNSNTNLIAVILAAGRGKRCKELTNQIPKCLFKVGKSTILERQISFFQKAGISKIVVIVGYKKDKIKKKLAKNVILVTNKKYSKTNTMYSLWIASKYWVGKTFIQINGDTICSYLDIKKIVNSNFANAILIDSNSKLDEESSKVIIKNNKIIAIGKKIAVSLASAEDLGIRKYSNRLSYELFKKYDDMIKRGSQKSFTHGILNKMLKDHKINPIQISKPWIEIDNPKDYKKAKKINFD